MNYKTERVLTSIDGMQRVRIVQRDGLFALVVEGHYENLFEGRVIAMGWRIQAGSASYFADVDIAEREARASYPWLSD